MLRTLLALAVLLAILVSWLVYELTVHQNELVLLERIRPHVCEEGVGYANATPDWLKNIGIKPKWMDRVTMIDVSGMTDGRVIFGIEGQPLVDFDDTDFDSIGHDLSRFGYLEDIYFPRTRLTDKSLPALAAYTSLKSIHLEESAVTSQGVRKLQADLPSIKIWYFHGNDK